MIYDINGSPMAMPMSDREAGISSIDIEYGRYEGSSYYLCRIPKKAINGKTITPKVALTTVNGQVGSSVYSTLDYAKRTKPVFCINAGLFFLSTRVPQGQTIINGVSITNIPMTDDHGTAISDDECYPLCIDANGNLSAPYERDVDTATMISNGVKYAVTGWGQFIEDYAQAPSSKYDEIVHPGKYIRQVIGQYQNGDYCVFTCDANKGTVTANEAGMTYAQVATLLIAKGVKFAYSLDGGGSCETVIGDRQINPIYENDTGRTIPTVIYWSLDD